VKVKSAFQIRNETPSLDGVVLRGLESFVDGRASVTESIVDGRASVTESIVDGRASVTESIVDGRASVTESIVDGLAVVVSSQSASISSTAFSAIIMTGAFRFVFGTSGMTDASTTRRNLTPRTLNLLSNTEVSAFPEAGPKRADPTIWIHVATSFLI